MIAAMITRTGLGLQLNSILVNTARTITENPTVRPILTAVFAALAVLWSSAWPYPSPRRS